MSTRYELRDFKLRVHLLYSSSPPKTLRSRRFVHSNNTVDENLAQFSSLRPQRTIAWTARAMGWCAAGSGGRVHCEPQQVR